MKKPLKIAGKPASLLAIQITKPVNSVQNSFHPSCSTTIPFLAIRYSLLSTPFLPSPTPIQMQNPIIKKNRSEIIVIRKADHASVGV